MSVRSIALLLCLLLLTGCGTIPGEPQVTESIPIQTGPSVSEPVPTETEPKEARPEPQDSDLVAVTDYIPDLLVEMKYASTDNFVGREIYRFSDVYLRYGTVKKLALVQKTLSAQGLRLKIWDGFRPVSAQFVLWEACPDPAYVSDPNAGYSSHSRGNTVDVTLADAQGRELNMPTGFDDFTPLADRNYSDCTEEEGSNALLLQGIMEENGFSGYYQEWWHFSDTETYPVEKAFDPALISRWYADCQEYITLRSAPELTAEAITRILVGEEVTLCGYEGAFALVDYHGSRGYVLASYLSPVETTVDSEKEILLNQPRYRALCENYISLRAEPDVSSEMITQIPAGGTFILLQWCEPFALVDYNGIYGYVVTEYMEPA